ncbi:MAG: peptidoglycan DD-metalloendopeptidase family protein [Rubrivivax sp.]|nr:peptidoglycan DD-metalloendopeptidase family protein [Rubrivivax sp.]
MKPFSLLIGALSLLALFTGCASPDHRAPVEDRKPPTVRPPVLTAPSTTTAAPAVPASAAAAPEVPAVKPPPGIENLGKPGYYQVKPGDTLIRIGLDNGQPWRDLARWNGLENPNLIEAGQVLRVTPPAPDPGAPAARPVAPSGRIETRPLEGSKPPAITAAAASAPAAPAVVAPPAPASSEDEPTWAWPAAGPVAAAFDDVKTKGLAITGKAGDPVLAAADGRVVYAGSSLRGYGNLVIIKHNATYLTAYAHNQKLLVKEDQPVARGQRIAEMGSTDAERVQLHFEIRRMGKPVDPARLLPPRP